MLTLLWYASKNKNEVIVLGHASVINCNIFSSMDPNACSISSSTIPTWNIVINLLPSSIVNRQCYPQPLAKVSSWCKQRKPLEKLFMPQSMLTQRNRNIRVESAIQPATVPIHEIILTKAMLSSLDQNGKTDAHLLLEGLTSNLFVVYPNNVIRTAGSGILFGYVRHLVVGAVNGMNQNSSHVSTSNTFPWTIDTSTDIRLEDVDEWQEVFCTSSIRLIVPVERIFIPVDNWSNMEKNDVNANFTTTEIRELWHCRLDPQKQVWKSLISLILKGQTKTSNS
jgi:hypothetical protein